MKQQPYDMKDHVYTINYLDINGEGVNDVVVMSETGVHIIKVSCLLHIAVFFLKHTI